MLKVTDIHLSFDSLRVLNGVSFEVPQGVMAGVIGPSGGGKSVLLKAMAGIIPPERGTIELPVEHCQCGDVSLMFQEGALFDSLSVFDNVAFPLVSGRVPAFILPRRTQAEVYERVSAIVARVGLSKALHKMPAQLSGGMRRRVSLARALVSRPKIVFLDDPTSGLDPVASSVIMDLIVELHREYRPTMLIVSHDLRRLLPVVEKLVALFNGRVVYQGRLDGLASSGDSQLCTFVSCRYDLSCRTTPIHQ